MILRRAPSEFGVENQTVTAPHANVVFSRERCWNTVSAYRLITPIPPLRNPDHYPRASRSNASRRTAGTACGIKSTATCSWLRTARTSTPTCTPTQPSTGVWWVAALIAQPSPLRWSSISRKAGRSPPRLCCSFLRLVPCALRLSILSPEKLRPRSRSLDYSLPHNEANSHAVKFLVSSAKIRGFVLLMRILCPLKLVEAVGPKRSPFLVFLCLVRVFAGAMPSRQVSKLGLVEISPDGGVAVSPESTPLPPDHIPVVSYRGTVTCQTRTGDIACFVAAPYQNANAGSRAPEDIRRRCVRKRLPP